MEYRVTFTRRAPIGETMLFVKGYGGSVNIDETLIFETNADLEKALVAAGLPFTISMKDIYGPTFVSGDALRTLGVKLLG